MGTAPTNLNLKDPRNIPVARWVKLQSTLPGGIGAPLSAFGTGAAGSNNIITGWTVVESDYKQSVARANALSGSGPFVKDNGSSGLIYVTAPVSRPMPTRVEFSCLMVPSAPATAFNLYIYACPITALKDFGSGSGTQIRLAPWAFGKAGVDQVNYITAMGADHFTVPLGQTYAFWLGGFPAGNATIWGNGNDAWQRWSVTTY